MQIAVLSGKGGTGKTTVATNLAQIMACRYVDCDVEEPNGFIFLKPKINESIEVETPVPVINEENCIDCKKCVDICQFNALVHTGKGIMLFDKLCHGCGACILACPIGAITEKGRSVGKIDVGKHGDMECLSGTLNIGEPMAVPIIGQLKNMIDEKTTIVDCSPGSSCSVVKAVENADYAILVTEPTAFGLHDLKIAVKLMKKMKIPFGVIINRVTEKENLISSYCHEEDILILGSIPFDREIAVLYSNGKLLVEKKVYEDMFKAIAAKLEEVS